MNVATASLQSLTLPIVGMSCTSCVNRVERALETIPGVIEANVNLAAERADVRFNGTIDASKLLKAVENLGYKATVRSINLAIDGMKCASCVRQMEKALLAVPGVTEAHVNLVDERAKVRGAASELSLIHI